MRKRDYTWLVWLVGVIVALGGIPWCWYSYMNRTPVVKIPTLTMPKPNAFDYYVAARKMLKDVSKIRDASLPAKTASTPVGLSTTSRKYTLAEKEALLKENAAALAKLREGFAYRYQSHSVRSMTKSSHYLSDLARLLRLEGNVREARGDLDGALRSYLEVIRFGEHIQHGEDDIDVQIGYFACDMGRRAIRAVIDKLDSRQALETAREVQDISSRSVHYVDVLQETRWNMLAWLMEEFNKPDWRGTLSNFNSGTTQFDVVRYKVFYTKRSIFNSFVDYHDRWIARVRLPYASATPMPYLQYDSLCVADGQYWGGFWIDFLNFGEVRNSFLTISLALRAYKLDHGSYPADLVDLTPHYLKSLPNDPFALKGTYGYKLRGSRYVLYSIGPDKKDDGGTPINDPDGVRGNSKGDIVSGANTK